MKKLMLIDANRHTQQGILRTAGPEFCLRQTGFHTTRYTVF